MGVASSAMPVTEHLKKNSQLQWGQSGESLDLLQPSEGVQFDRPNGYLPELPDDLTIVSDRELMDLMVQFTGWQNFMDTLFVAAEEAEADAMSALELQEAYAMSESGTTQVTKAKAIARSQPDVVAASVSSRDAKAIRKALGMKVSNLDRLAFIVSRELTRRLGRAPQEARVARHGGA